MSPPLPCLTEDLESVQARVRRDRDPQWRPRVHLWVLRTSGQVATRRQAAAHLAVHRHTVALWLRTYRQGGLTALWTSQEAGAPSGPKRLPAAVCAPCQARLATARGFASYGAI